MYLTKTNTNLRHQIVRPIMVCQNYKLPPAKLFIPQGHENNSSTSAPNKHNTANVTTTDLKNTCRHSRFDLIQRQRLTSSSVHGFQSQPFFFPQNLRVLQQICRGSTRDCGWKISPKQFSWNPIAYLQMFLFLSNSGWLKSHF